MIGAITPYLTHPVHSQVQPMSDIESFLLLYGYTMIGLLVYLILDKYVLFRLPWFLRVSVTLMCYPAAWLLGLWTWIHRRDRPRRVRTVPTWEKEKWTQRPRNEDIWMN
jgi:hypothetical protein